MGQLFNHVKIKVPMPKILLIISLGFSFKITRRPIIDPKHIPIYKKDSTMYVFFMPNLVKLFWFSLLC